MKARSYMKAIQAQVMADNGGRVPEHLELTIANYAAALELRDVYRKEVMKQPTMIEVGSTGQSTTKQNPLCSLLYQQDQLCLSYAKALGGTSAKAAAKPESKSSQNATDVLTEYVEAIKD